MVVDARARAVVEVLSSAAQLRFTNTGAFLRVPELCCTASFDLIDAFVAALRVVPEVARFVFHCVCAFAGASRPVKLESIVTGTEAPAVVYRRVPDLIEVAGVRNELASAVSVVHVEVAVALLSWTHSRVLN